MKRSSLLMWLLVLTIGVASRFAPGSGALAPAEPITVVTHVDVVPPFTAAGRELSQRLYPFDEGQLDARAAYDPPLPTPAQTAIPPRHRPLFKIRFPG